MLPEPDAPITPSPDDAPPAAAPAPAPTPTVPAPAPVPPTPVPAPVPFLWSAPPVSAPVPVPAAPRVEGLTNLPSGEPILDQATVLRLKLDETQQQLVNQQIGSARQDARERAYRYVYKELGVATLAEAQQLIAEARGRQSQYSETARNLETQVEATRLDAEGRLSQARQEITQAQAERDQYLRLSEQALRVAEVRVAAIRQQFRDPDDAVRYLALHTFPVNLADQSVGGVSEAVAALAAERSYLIATAEPIPVPDVVQAPAPAPVVSATPQAPGLLDGSSAEQEAAYASLRRDVRTYF